ncbi:hypothetical protein [Gallaecimonas sp. GXIMD4217]|uniref:hypothetical protein n=1 Tax=Gallaecimonas sp. GXIMD4217 TaxID=3131927 RepID=UPI00311B4041
MKTLLLSFSLLSAQALACLQSPADGLHYRISQHGQSQDIYLWVEEDRKVRYRPDQQQVEVWQRQNSRLELDKHFLDSGKTLSYYQGDLRTLGLPLDWPSQGSPVSPALLEGLAGESHEDVHCQKASRYQKGQAELIWLSDWQLPASLSQGDYRLELVGQAGLDLKALERRWRGFEQIDFADIGDMEGDPVIGKLIKQGFVEHGDHH